MPRIATRRGLADPTVLIPGVLAAIPMLWVEASRKALVGDVPREGFSTSESSSGHWFAEAGEVELAGEPVMTLAEAIGVPGEGRVGSRRGGWFASWGAGGERRAAR